VASSCDHKNEPVCVIKDGQFLGREEGGR
jgi:hypothetical protein